MASAPIAAAGLGDNTVVAAVTGKKIRVRRFELSNTVATAQSAKWKSGAATDLTGAFASAAVGPMGDASADDPQAYDFLFETNAGEALVLNLSAATAVGGFVDYTLV